MTISTFPTPRGETQRVDRNGIKGLARAVVGVGLFAVAILASAGTYAWPAGWAYILLVAFGSACFRLVVAWKNPGLISIRAKVGQGTKWWDKVFLAIYLPITFALVVVAGFDAVRFGWSTMSPWLWPVGFVLFAGATALGAWAMAINPHFESTVRIQHDRGHRVIDSGPYRFVRHPGYLSALGSTLSTPLLLGSWWAFVPAALLAATFVVRTLLEDRTLHRELPGYAEYAARVRCRLLPGLW
ncbi:MAG: isoprenylcysteine carboxylmethyltransferase family protein [Deltaproteobacteria bacterium]|jgi:protein-S-isoprenylcysteine O-methyltransferase Ste14|nr:isoprenylcysteine carboxylmethyltransferase family protein [Deltaproteobacteria bacterium]MBW2533264.1 isoprenylcysteine carboxylmethyltransferase family protein [Deltaproteobacteria bacterium]